MRSANPARPLSSTDEDNSRYFSEAYETEAAAKFEALARLEGRVSRYRPMYEVDEVGRP